MCSNHVAYGSHYRVTFVAAAIAWLCCVIAPTVTLRVALATHSVAQQLLAPLTLPPLFLTCSFSDGDRTWLLALLDAASGIGRWHRRCAYVRGSGPGPHPTGGHISSSSGPQRPAEKRAMRSIPIRFTCIGSYRRAYALHGSPLLREWTGHAASWGRESRV